MWWVPGESVPLAYGVRCCQKQALSRACVEVVMVVAVSKDTEDAMALSASSWLARHPTNRHDEPAAAKQD